MGIPRGPFSFGRSVKSGMGIKVILFDCGGVLLRERGSSAYPAWEARLGLQPGELRRLLWQGEAWALAERGLLDERAFWERAGASLGLTDPQEIQALSEDLWYSLAVDPQVLALVDRARARYRVAMLSNSTDALEEYLERRFGITDRFEKIFNSARLGVAKPDKAIFEEALRQLGVKPFEVLFIDDQAANIAAAAALGMHVIWFVSPEELERQMAAYLDHEALPPPETPQ